MTLKYNFVMHLYLFPYPHKYLTILYNFSTISIINIIEKFKNINQTNEQVVTVEEKENRDHA
jgi:hypothetical protein